MPNKYSVTLAEMRDPRFKVIRRTLHQNRIGCLTEWNDHSPRRCSPTSVQHNRHAVTIIEALAEAKLLNPQRILG